MLTHFQLHWLQWTHKIWICKLLILNWKWSSYITLRHCWAIRRFRGVAIIDHYIAACRLIYQVYVLALFCSTSSDHLILFVLLKHENPLKKLITLVNFRLKSFKKGFRKIIHCLFFLWNYGKDSYTTHSWIPPKTFPWNAGLVKY